MNQAADQAQLIELEKQRGEALVNRDRAALDRLFSDDLVHIHTTGILQNKAELMNHALNVLKFEKVTRSDLKIRFYGNDVAVMTGAMANTMHRDETPDKVVSSQALVTQVWVRQGDSWKQVSFHSVRAAEKDKS